MSAKPRHSATYRAAAALALVLAVPAAAQTAPAAPSAGPAPTYADLAGLADSAALVLRAQVLKTTRIEDSRAKGLQPGFGRFYVEARTRALLLGAGGIGESARYLADLPLDAKGKPPRLKKREVLLFARPVAGRPGELQLVSPRAQVVWDAGLEARLRPVLTALVSPDAPARVTGVRELLYVPGTLAGQGETQIFLNTADGSAASIGVRHQPGAAPQWGASFSELVGDLGNPPAAETLEWYRLACFLPNNPPAAANVSETEAARRQAVADYRMVVGELGACERTL